MFGDKSIGCLFMINYQCKRYVKLLDILEEGRIF